MHTPFERFERSDIGEHLSTLRQLASGKVVLELGVRQGESTKAFLNTCASLTSVDRDDCSAISHDPKWHFIQGNSLRCLIHGKYDVVFIDTSHRYKDTLLELRRFHNFLHPGGCIVLHDANPPLKAKLRGRGGVLKAILRFMNEQPALWSLTYHDNNNGLAILKRR